MKRMHFFSCFGSLNSRLSFHALMSIKLAKATCALTITCLLLSTDLVQKDELCSWQGGREVGVGGVDLER